MEGISIGEDCGQWYIGLNFEVRSPDDVTGWHYWDRNGRYLLDEDMCLLKQETRLSPKCLIMW